MIWANSPEARSSAGFGAVLPAGRMRSFSTGESMMAVSSWAWPARQSARPGFRVSWKKSFESAGLRRSASISRVEMRKLRAGDRVVGCGKAFAFGWERAGKEEGAAGFFAAEQGER